MSTTTKRTAADKAAEHEADAQAALDEANVEPATPEADDLPERLELLAAGLTKGDRPAANAMREAAARLRQR